LGESQEHGETWEHHAAFDIADERYVRIAALGELRLRQAAREAERSQVRSENLTFFRRCRHSRALTKRSHELIF
jgi:hypothetical protein